MISFVIDVSQYILLFSLNLQSCLILDISECSQIGPSYLLFTLKEYVTTKKLTGDVKQAYGVAM